MKVALLHNLNRGEHPYESEFDLPLTIDFVTEVLEKAHEITPIEGTRDFVRWLTQLTLSQPDIVFNVAEGYKGAAREAVYPAVLEQMDIPYCGPGPTELIVCHNKSLTKKLLADKQIPMAWSRLLTSMEDLSQLEHIDIPFPLIVKLNSEGSSLGMDENCIVRTWKELQMQVMKVLKTFHTNVLVEQYIDGLDVSMTFVEGMGVFGPVQYTYPSGDIYDYRLKTADNYDVDIIVPPSLSKETRLILKSYTNTVIAALDMNGYGRADFRISPDGKIYFLEMNAQVSFHPQGAFLLAPESEGRTREEVILHIVKHAAQSTRRTSAVGR